ncbi:TetR family transcriptional regulator [Brachybacterium phenoliresistens]|uniref:TetR family transcriptional regulator n=2 Tax=Brachybacterium phenoliresistens TaxID=396014 RepID=Z9JW04_9MICO|nr:TetR family transcriptional regulator [Brachybacterium phenoliresistens]
MIRAMPDDDTTGPGPRRRRGPYAKSAERRREIVEAALHEFSENGFRGATMKAITERIGVTQPLIYSYFSSKEELLTAVLELRDDRGFDISPLDPSRPVESVRALVELMRHNEAHPGIVALHCAIAGEAVTSGHPAHDSFRRRYVDARTRIGAILEACREAGRLREGVDPQRAARIVVAAMDGLQTQWILEPEVEHLGDEFEAFMRTLVDF